MSKHTHGPFKLHSSKPPSLAEVSPRVARKREREALEKAALRARTNLTRSEAFEGTST